MTEDERRAIETLAAELERRGLEADLFHPSEAYDWFEALKVTGFELRK